jgi:hypothetical protein
MSEDHQEQNQAQSLRQEPPSPTTADDIRHRLKEFGEQEPGFSQAAQQMIDSTVPELLAEVFLYLLTTPPTTGLGQVGRSMGGFLMNVDHLEPLEPCLSLRKINEEAFELGIRQTVYGQSSRNNRLVLFIGGGERSIILRISRDREIRLNNQPVPSSPEWENLLSQKIQTELSKF